MNAMKKKFFYFIAAGLSLWMCGNVNAQQVNPPLIPPPPVDPTARTLSAVEKISPGTFLIGDIQIIKSKKSVSFPATVNMDKGLLEYLLVQGAGKTHESLFRTKVQPYDLQVALLLLGFEGTDTPLGSQGDPAKPEGEPVELTITYKKADGTSVTVMPEEWLIKTVDDKHRGVSAMDWVFTGSMVADGQFMAQMSGSIAAIFHDPSAMIDNASPGGESDEVWFVKEGAVPPVGTPVTINIKAKTKK
ncbi:MAG: hypothetical protein HY808_14950 [Nitrospirae bacterium]|nr:hypothetical protein [Nitrospirota bacterium]